MRVQVVAVPRGEQAPEPAVGFEQVEEVVAEHLPHPVAVGPAPQRPHVDHVVAHEQVGPGAGGAAVDPERGHRRADHVGRAADGERPGRPRPARAEVGEHPPEPAVPADRVAEEPGPLGRQGVGRAHHLHPQPRVPAQLPQNAAAHLERLPVVPRQLDQSLRVGGEEPLQLRVDVALADADVAAVGEAVFEEPVGVTAGHRQPAPLQAPDRVPRGGRGEARRGGQGLGHRKAP